MYDLLDGFMCSLMLPLQFDWVRIHDGGSVFNTRWQFEGAKCLGERLKLLLTYVPLWFFLYADFS